MTITEFKTRGVIADAPGGPDVLRLQDITLPWPAEPDAVLVRMEAASINPADSFFRQLGMYLETDAPPVLGHDGCGVVLETGGGVSALAPGDRVCFCHGGIGGAPGTHAEHAVVPASLLVKVPDSVDVAQAAALPLVAITAWEALHERLAIGDGESVLIHGGAGGTGHVAVQLARLAGARVATTVSNADKAAFATDLGAHHAILYPQTDFVEACKAWTDGHGLDAALDNVSTEVFQRTFAAMRPYGRLVTLIGLPGDDADETAYVANLTLHNLMMLSPQIFGLGDRLRGQAAILKKAMELAADGRLEAHIAAEFSLADAAEAHRRIDAGGTMGKLILRMDGAT